MAASVLVTAASVDAGWIYNELEAPARAAIVEAVRARMGSDVDVTIGALQIRQANGARPSSSIAAVPDVGARIGGFVRFALYDRGTTSTAGAAVTRQMSGRRVGTADAEIFVIADQVRARHAIPRGQVIAKDDVEVVREDLGRMPLKTLPGARLAIGARALRSIAAGERIAATMIAATAMVKSGDAVQTIVRLGSLEARGTAIATQTGTLGEEIGLVNVNSRRTLRGRVIGEREVEVMHEH
jgi:flagella basal body P-ring formation protein FlgA